ncbi:MAG: FHIPEP family type III secretion protein [Candidatus Xenobiia bacterium LiM19]
MSTLLPIEEKRLRKIIEQNPKNLNARFRLGALLEEEKRWAEAGLEFQCVLEGDPGNNRAYHHLQTIKNRLREQEHNISYDSISFSTPFQGPLHFDEHSWIISRHEGSLSLTPVFFKYRDISERISDNHVAAMLEKWSSGGRESIAAITFRSEEELYESGSVLQLQLGRAHLPQRERLIEQCQSLLSSIESESLITMPLLDITQCDDLQAERFRLFWGLKMLCHGGMKAGFLFLPEDSTSKNHDNSVIFDEMLMQRGQWLPEEEIKQASAEKSDPQPLDTITYLVEVLRHTLTAHIHLFWKTGQTIQLISGLRDAHPSLPWKMLEERITILSFHHLIRYYLFSGGKIGTIIELFEDIADHLDRAPHHYGRCAYVDDRLYRRFDIYELIYGGNVMAFSAPAALEDGILLSLSGSEHEHGGMGAAFPGQLLGYIDRVSKKIEERGKKPLLICHRHIRPMILESAGASQHTPILTYDEIPSMVSLAFFEDPPEQASTPLSLGASQITICSARRAELLENDLKGRSFAYFEKGGHRMLFSIYGRLSAGDGSLISSIFELQERGYSLSGIFRCTSCRALPPSSESPESPESLESPPSRRRISLSLGRGLFDRNDRGEALQASCRDFREMFRTEFGISIPEVHIELVESLEPLSYQISYAGSLIISRSSLSPDHGRSADSNNDGEEIQKTLRQFILSHIKELITYETVEQYCRGVKAPEDDNTASLLPPQYPGILKSVLGNLLEESIPCSERELIITRTAELLKCSSDPLYIAEMLRKDLRKTIYSLYSSDNGTVCAVFLSSDFEVILTSDFVSAQLVETLSENPPPASLSPLHPVLRGQAGDRSKEREYIAQLIVKEYFHTQGSITMKPLVCAATIRKLLWRLIHPIVPELTVLSRDEIAGWPFHSEGEVEAPKGFRSFIVDETLKSRILDDYDTVEKKAAARILAHISGGPYSEMVREKKASLPEAHTFHISIGPHIARIIDAGNDRCRFFTLLLYLREWMKRSLKRDIPRVIISIDSELSPMEVGFNCRNLFDFRMTLPEGLMMEYPAPSTTDELLACPEGSLSFPSRGESSSPAHRFLGSKVRLEAGEVILLNLCALLLNNSRHYEIEEPLRKTLNHMAGQCGIDEPDALWKDPGTMNLHPLTALEFLRQKGRPAHILSRQALQREARKEFAVPYDTFLLADRQGRLHAITLGDPLEDFLGGYFREFDEELLLATLPPSLRTIRTRLAESLKRLMEKGLPPLIITERCEPSHLIRLLYMEIPHITVLRKDELPFGIQTAERERVELSDSDLYLHPAGEPVSSLSGFITYRDFYLICGLFCDYDGDSIQGAAFYDRLLSLVPDHLSGLWRASFCHQRNGSRDRARTLRRRARKLFRSIALSEPAYYCLDIRQAEREYSLLKGGEKNPQILFRIGYCQYQMGENDRAEISLKEAITELPFDDEAQALMGHLLSERERYQEALVCYKKALALNPYNDEAVTGIAAVLSERSEIAAPWKISRNSYSSAPFDNDRLHSLGMAGADFDDYESMHKCAAELLKRDAHNSAAYFMRSRSLHSMGLRLEELDDLREALHIKPHSVLYNRTAGDTLWSMGRYEEAVAHYTAAFTQSVDQKDDDIEPHEYLHRAKILMKFGESSSSRRILKEALEKYRDHPALLHLCGEAALNEGDLEEASASFAAAREINPMSSCYAMSLAETSLLEGDRETAALIYQNVLHRSPDWPLPWQRLAHMAAEDREYEKAAELLSKGISWAPQYLDFYVLLFSVLRRPSRLIEWQRRFQERSFLSPDSAVYHFCLSFITTLQGDLVKGRDEMERAYLTAPESPQIVEYFCRYLLMDGEVEKSLVILRVAQKRILRRSSLFFLEGIAWRALGNTVRAQESFMRSAACSPLFPYARTSRGYAALLDNNAPGAECEARKALKYNSAFAPAAQLLAEVGRLRGDEGDLRSPIDMLHSPEGWGLERGRS